MKCVMYLPIASFDRNRFGLLIHADINSGPLRNPAHLPSVEQTVILEWALHISLPGCGAGPRGTAGVGRLFNPISREATPPRAGVVRGREGPADLAGLGAGDGQRRETTEDSLVCLQSIECWGRHEPVSELLVTGAMFRRRPWPPREAVLHEGSNQKERKTTKET